MGKFPGAELLVGLLTAEMEDLSTRGNWYMEVDPVTVFLIISQLQLAWRHPKQSESQLELIRKVVDMLAEGFKGCPAALRTIELGWVKEFDS